MKRANRYRKREFNFDLFPRNKNNISVIKQNMNKNNKNDNLEYFQHNDNIFDTKEDIANGFNHYFTNIPKLLVSNIDKCISFHTMKTYFKSLPVLDEVFSFHNIKSEYIICFISNLRNINSSGFDNISNKASRYIKNIISILLTLIINQSIQLKFKNCYNNTSFFKKITVTYLVITGLYRCFLWFQKSLKK